MTPRVHSAYPLFVQLKDRIQAVHKEVLLLILLSAATVPLFLFTRSAASLNRSVRARVAEFWYEDGIRKLEQDQAAAAVDSFRKAATNDRDNPDYRLALARALVSEGNVQEARRALLHLREAAPESGEINLDLARLEAGAGDSGDLQEAVRYYHSSLYGVWPEEELDRRRREVRVELIDFLLVRNEISSVLSELLVLSRDMQDTPSGHTLVGELFLKAGEPRRAVDHFVSALESEPDNLDALSGAGEAYFELADYGRAVRYLRMAGEEDGASDNVRSLLRITALVIENDPLAPRLPVSQRIARFQRLFGAAQRRLAACQEEAHNPLLDALVAEVMRLEPELTPAKIRSDQELITTGLGLAYRIEALAGQTCRDASENETALVLIARLHGIVENEQSDR
jgi:tetratricopeptide (TPR) repeat protein